MKKYLLLAVSLILIFAACNKKPGTPTATRESMLRSGKWKITSGTLTVRLSNGGDTVLNYMNWIPACRQDDYLVFDSGYHGAIFSNSTKCNASDADSISFLWQFSNSFNNLSLYNGFDFFYGISDSVLAFRFDTLQQSPLVLDTLHGVLDTTAGYTRVVIILDTIWKRQFDSVSLPVTAVYNAAVTNFSQSSFTLSYTLVLPPITSYPDTTNHHTGWIIDNTTTPPDTLDYLPIYRADTFKYNVTYTNF
jgi:opacity protein-like surface antigen